MSKKKETAPEPDVKTRLLEAAATLLAETGAPDTITTRQITERAGSALGLVNYHFGSRANLMAQVIEIRMGELARNLMRVPGSVGSPRDRLMEMLCGLVDFGAQHLALMQTSVRHILLTGAVDAQILLLPLLRECFGSSRPEADLRLVSHQMVSVLQLAALNPEAFRAFTGLDPMDRNQRRQAVSFVVDSHIGNLSGQPSQTALPGMPISQSD